MNISNHFLQKYYPTRKLYVWALALIYIAPISLLAAQHKITYDDFVKFIEQDLETLASKNNDDHINKTDLTSTWAQTKLGNELSISLKNLKDALKKDSNSIIKGASKTLIKKGSEIGFARKLNLLTEDGIGLIEKKDFNLDKLTLKTLARFYKNKNNIEIITAILQVHKKTVTEKIMKELQTNSKAWEHLQYLLDYNNEKGIPTLNLSYKTIDLSFDLLFQHSDNESCEIVIRDMVEKQPKKGTQFIIEALKHTNDKRAWILLDAVFKELSAENLNLKDKLELELKNQLKSKKEDNKTKSIEALLVDKYLAGMQFKNMDWYDLPNITKNILEISAKTKEFAKEACSRLATSDDQDSIEAIWEILGELNVKLELYNLPYNKLLRNWNLDKVKGILKKLLSKQNRETAQLVANNAFKVNGNQSSIYFWEFLQFLIKNKKGPKIAATQINATNMTLEAALKGAEKNPKLLMKILKEGPKENRARALTLVNKAFQNSKFQEESFFWNLLDCLITDKKGPKVDATQIDATNMTLKTALDGADDYANTLMKILKEGPEKNRTRALTLVNQAFQDDNSQEPDDFWDLLNCLITDERGPEVKITKINATKMTLQTALDGASLYSETLMKILKEDKITALRLVNEAFQDDKFQNKFFFWNLLRCLITDEKGPKIAATQIDATNMTLKTALDGAKKKPKLLMKILKEGPEKNKARALTLLQEAFTGNNQNSNEFWNLVHCLIAHKDGPKIEAQQIKFEKFKVNSVYEAFFSKRIENDVIESVLRSYPDQAKKLVKEILSNQNLFSKQNIEELLHWLIFDSNTNNQDAIVPLAKIDITIEAAVQIFHYLLQNQPNPKLSKILNNVVYQQPFQSKAEKKVKDILNDNTELSKLANIELLYWLIFDSHTNNQDAIVPPAKIDITIEAAVAIFHYLLQNQPNPKLSEILNNVLRNNPLQGEAEEKVKDILNDDTELNKPANIELLHWLIFDSNTNNQGTIVPLANINITPKRAIEILQNQPSPKLSEILNSAIKTQPSIGKGMLEIAINGQTGSPLNWSNTNVDFDLLHLLMLDPNGPQLTIEGADLASLDLSAIEIHISKPNALQLFKKILHAPNNVNRFNALHHAIFPSNSNSSSTFDYQNVDWDTTKWGSIPALKELIKPIDLPEDIVVKRLQDDGFTHKAIVRDIVLASSSNLLEKVLNIAFPNVTVTSTTPTPTIAWSQSLSETSWDIVASLTNSKYGIIKAKEVIQKVMPGISSSDAHFARNYNLSSVRWEDFDWEAFEGLAEQSNIANFSIQNYLTIAENVLPGLRFVDQEPEVSQIHWDQIKSYKVVNFLIKKEIIPKKILINAPRSLLKQRINNVARLSLAEANFWKNTQEEKSKYYWSFAPYAVGLVLASAIVLLYIFNKQEKKKGSHNEEAKVQTQHNINNKQFHKIRSR